MLVKHDAGLLFALGLMAMAAPSEAGTYRNGEYGFQVSIPDDLHTCPGMSWVHEHGIGISLDGPVDCGSGIKAPGMNVWGDYNGPVWDGLAAIRDALCQPEKKTDRIVEAPALPPLGRRPSATCRTDHADGWIDIEVFAASIEVFGKEDNDDAGKPVIYYTAGLSTTMDRLDRDLPRFRDLLKAVRFFRREECKNPSPFGCVAPGAFNSDPSPPR